MNSQVNQSSGVFSMTVTRVTAGSDSVAIAEAVVVCDRIQAEIQAMCVVGGRGNRCVVVDAVKQRAAQIKRDVTAVAGENNPEVQPGS
jgi:hypothetical protein